MPGAVVLVARHGVIAAERAFGAKDRSPDEPMTLDTLFDLESVTKVMTAATVLALADDGKLALTDPVAKWLPAFAAAGKDHVTIDDLLIHSSGLPGDVESGPTDPADAIWQRMFESKLEYPTRSRVGYSDLGYRTLGRIIETATKEPLDRVMRERVFARLDLHDTVYTPPASLRSRIAGTGPDTARGHALRGELADDRDFALGGVVGCDGVFATAHDLAVFSQMVLSGGGHVVSPANAALMSTNQTPWVDSASTDANWASSFFAGPKTAGWELVTPHAYGGALSSRAFCKAGVAGTFVCVDPSTELIAIYLTNLGKPSFDEKGLADWYDAIAPDRFFALVASAARP